jgi:cyclophilin family peptidyl-prolyl cis-trans isomerase
VDDPTWQRASVLTVLALFGVLTISSAVALGDPAPAEVTIRGCPVAHASPPRTAHLHRPPQTVTRSDRLIAIVKTNCGRFQIRLDARRAPITVNSFVYLARSGFYRGLDFYRVVPEFVIQAGDPREAGTGGAGYSTTEPPPRHFHFHLGAVAMAKAFADPPGWAGSIFFVVAGREGRLLPNEYAILGQVSAGMGTVERIDALGTEDEKPRQVVKIDWIKIRDLGSV